MERLKAERLAAERRSLKPGPLVLKTFREKRTAVPRTMDTETCEIASAILGRVTKSVTAEMFREMLLATHPDKGGDSQMFVRVKRCYDKFRLEYR